jgi:uncharacterized protein (TIGR02246 family)
MKERLFIADVAQIYELLLDYATAINDGDIERWISLWTEEGIQMPPVTLRCVGKSEIRREMQHQFELFQTSKMSIQTDEVRILGDWAYSHGIYEFEMTPKSGEESSLVSGKFLDILEKQSDGTWRIAINCYNYTTPPV